MAADCRAAHFRSAGWSARVPSPCAPFHPPPLPPAAPFHPPAFSRRLPGSLGEPSRRKLCLTHSLMKTRLWCKFPRKTATTLQNEGCREAWHPDPRAGPALRSPDPRVGPVPRSCTSGGDRTCLARSAELQPGVILVLCPACVCPPTPPQFSQNPHNYCREGRPHGAA